MPKREIAEQIEWRVVHKICDKNKNNNGSEARETKDDFFV